MAILRAGCGRLAAEHMKSTFRSALAIVLIITGFGTILEKSEASPSLDLRGAWQLKSVAGKDPTIINIKSWRIEFQGHEKWIYSGTMAGEFEGTQLNGSGTWLLDGNQLRYTAGDNTGTTTVRIEGSSLKLSPDPVLRVSGKEPIDTEYMRLAKPSK